MDRKTLYRSVPHHGPNVLTFMGGNPLANVTALKSGLSGIC